MKRAVALFTTVMFAAIVLIMAPSAAAAYNFGDHRSETLVGKAWQSLADDDIEAVLAYTNKCIELYASHAQKMQESLTGYPQGEKQDIFGFWALNDVATSYYIQGEAFRKAEMMDEAREAYEALINQYTYGQTWDTKGWFWKPAEAAQEKIAMMDSGTELDFGDYTSSHLATKAWQALNANDAETVNIYVKKCLDLYAPKAKEMQESLTEYPWESKDKIFSYWALNDVGTCLFIQGEAYRKNGDMAKAKDSFRKLVDDYFYAQCWDPNGWFWKPAEAAQQKLDELGGA